MSDATSDHPAIDQAGVGMVDRLRHAPPRREYYAYFTLIFLAALPLAFLTWALSAARLLRLPEKGRLRAPGRKPASSRRTSFRRKDHSRQRGIRCSIAGRTGRRTATGDEPS